VARTAGFDPEQIFPVQTITPFYTPITVIDCPVMLLARLTSDSVLDAAYAWLWYWRCGYPVAINNSSVSAADGINGKDSRF
jgi:hypothetical protein